MDRTPVKVDATGVSAGQLAHLIDALGEVVLRRDQVGDLADSIEAALPGLVREAVKVQRDTKAAVFTVTVHRLPVHVPGLGDIPLVDSLTITEGEAAS